MTPTLDLATLRQWIGRSETRVETLDPRPLRLAASILPDYGATLGPMRHWFYFLDAPRLDALGRDGHAALGGFLPPVALPRRMWAGGRLDFDAALRPGETVARTVEVAELRRKDGRSGPLCFVTTRAVLETSGARRLTEERDLVYRADPDPDGPAPETPRVDAAPEFSARVAPSATLLFRYSALTFNGHRIHYDLDYCRDVEGYPHLVVHGPLLATLLADLAVAQAPGAALRRFSYRARSPLFADAPFWLEGRGGAVDGLALWARAEDGRLAMTAEAQFS